MLSDLAWLLWTQNSSTVVSSGHWECLSRPWESSFRTSHLLNETFMWMPLFSMSVWGSVPSQLPPKDKYRPQWAPPCIQSKSTLQQLPFAVRCSFIVPIWFLTVLLFLLIADFFSRYHCLWCWSLHQILIPAQWGLLQGTAGTTDFQGARCRVHLHASPYIRVPWDKPLQTQLFSFELGKLSVVVS